MDKGHNRWKSPTLPTDLRREELERIRMASSTYELDEDRRTIVLRAIVDVCQQRKWDLLAIHVRTSHLHFVVRADITPERMMRDCKAAASARLNESGLDTPNTRRWARHGSTRYLWKLVNVAAAMEYVLYQQGAPMAVWKSEPRP